VLAPRCTPGHGAATADPLSVRCVYSRGRSVRAVVGRSPPARLFSRVELVLFVFFSSARESKSMSRSKRRRQEGRSNTARLPGVGLLQDTLQLPDIARPVVVA